MKKFPIILTFLFFTSTVYASPVNVNRLTDHIEPLVVTDYIKGIFFNASSTTATSTLPRVSSTGVSTSWLCLAGDCKSGWPGLSGFTTDDLSEGVTNLYFTAPRAISAVLTASTLNAIPYHAPTGLEDSIIRYETGVINIGHTPGFTGTSLLNVNGSINIPSGYSYKYNGSALTVADLGLTNSDGLAEGSTNLYVTPTDRTHLSNLSGVNTGDQNYTQLGVTGTPSSSTYLRGDGTWNTPPGGVSGGSSGMLTSWTNSTTLTATGTPTAAAYTATSTTATSTFAGNIVIGNGYTTPYLNGLFSTPTQVQITTNVSDLTSNLVIGNVDNSVYSTGGMTLINSRSTGGLFGTYYGYLGFSGPNFAAFTGLPPNSMVMNVTDGSHVTGATSMNPASSTIVRAIGSGLTTSNWDEVMRFIVDGSVASTSAMGYGTTTPVARFAIVGLATSTKPIFLVASTTNGSYASNSNIFTIANSTTTITNDLLGTGTSDLTTLYTGTLSTVADAGVVTWTNIPISGASNGTPQSLNAAIGGSTVLTVYGESNGSGLSKNLRVGIGSTTPMAALSVSGSTTSATSWAFAVADVASSTKFIIRDDGVVGIGTTSPFASLSLTGSSSFIPFAISSTTSTLASSTLFMVDKAGDVHYGGGTPTLSSCGTGPSLGANSTDQSGTVTVGATATGCTITFSTAKLSSPHCIVTAETMSLVNALSYTQTASALTLSQTGASGNYNYFCPLGH